MLRMLRTAATDMIETPGRDAATPGSGLTFAGAVDSRYLTAPDGALPIPFGRIVILLAGECTHVCFHALVTFP